MQEILKKYLAETIGTFCLVLISAGAALANLQSGGELGILGPALASGFALAVMIYAFYNVSGAHINPAVTVGLWVTGHIKTLLALGYLVSQAVGSVLAALLLKVLFAGASAQFYLGDAGLSSGVSPYVGILAEAAFTFILLLVIFGTLVDKKGNSTIGPLAAGLTLTLAIIVLGNITGGALNPARSFGPAFITSHWINHYVYWIGPIAGGALGALVYQFCFLKKN